MTFLAIGGLICLGCFLFLLFVLAAFLIWASYDEKATKKRLQEEGTPVLAVLVMANSQFLNSDTIPSAPALGMFTFEDPSPDLAHDMREIASELFRLYTAEDAEVQRMPEPQQEMAARLKDDNYRPDRRTRVARELSRGHTLYLADLMLERQDIPEHTAHTKSLACLVTGKDKGEIMVLSYQEEAADRIYRAIGVH